MSWTLTAGVCVAVASSFLTMVIVAETKPYINEDDEEEYTLSGYLLLAGAYAIKWPIKTLVRAIRHRKVIQEVHNYDNVVSFNHNPPEGWIYDAQYDPFVEPFEAVETENEFELVV